MKHLLYFVLVIFYTLYSNEKILSFTSFLILYWIILKFWREGEPKIFFAGILYFWISITIKIFYSDFSETNYSDLSISPNIVQTTFVALLSLVVFSWGIILNLKKDYEIVSYDKIIMAKRYNINKVILFYSISVIISIFLKQFLFVVPGLSQLVNELIFIRNGLAFLLLFVMIAKKQKYTLVISILTIETIINMYSIFSNFKDVLIILLITIGAFYSILTVKQKTTSFLMLIVLIYLMSIWQSVKGDYRIFLTGGQKSQSVVVSREEALSKLRDLTFRKNTNTDDKETYKTIERISYIEFFSQATDNVPKKLPFEYGEIWKENILHILMPRILFPDKPAIDDSYMVNKYCSRRVSTAKDGTTFSLGFLAESYIDFGYLFMFFPIFGVGWLIGKIYIYILEHSYNIYWGYINTVPMWYFVYCIGIPGTKILGWLFWHLIVFFIINSFFVKKVDKYLKS